MIPIDNLIRNTIQLGVLFFVVVSGKNLQVFHEKIIRKENINKNITNINKLNNNIIQLSKINLIYWYLIVFFDITVQKERINTISRLNNKGCFLSWISLSFGNKNNKQSLKN